MVEDVTDIELVRYVARTSFASQACPPWRDDAVLRAIESPFQRRMVEFDMRKNVLAAIDSTPFDVLMIDLIDDRFALLEFQPGRFATASNEFVNALADSPRGRRIANTSAEFDALWTDGFVRLVRLLETKQQLHKLRINRVFWSGQDTEGRPLPKFDAKAISAANAALAARYRQMAALIPSSAFYEYADVCFVADPQHRWGLSPYHYVTGLYRATLAHLRQEQRQGC